MKNNFKLLIVLGLISFNIHSQGCSDAGFCVLQNTKEIDNFLAKHNSVTVGTGFGMGFEKVNFSNSYLEYGYNINEKIGLQTKLTYQNITGDFGKNGGFGDLFLIANYRPSTVNEFDFRFLIGTKIPLNTANAKNENGFSLPMEYQTSLGTYDVIVGTSMIYDKKWDFTVALQVPISNINENQFSPVFFNNTDKYNQTTGFTRKPDALLKVGCFFTINESRFSINPTFLGIFHLGKDSFTDALNNRVAIEKSDGFTLNCVINSILTFKDDSQLTLAIATPSPVRTAIRPDGLVRIFGVNLQYKIKF